MIKLSNKEKSEISSWAKKLPKIAVPYRGLIPYTGQQIVDGEAEYNTGEKNAKGVLEYVTKKVDANEFIKAVGSSFNRTTMYKVQTIKFKEFNHKKEMLKIGNTIGWNGVLEYMKPYLNDEAKEVLKNK